MSIGIDFILRAKTEAFTRGMATANNALKDTKKSLREFDVGNGLKQALGIGGVIAGLRSAIDNAQELRDKAIELGHAVDASTKSVAEYGDSLDGLWKGTKNLATEGLSFFTRAGEGWGMLINRIRGVTREQEIQAEEGARLAAKMEKERDANAKKHQETLDRLVEAERRVMEQRKENAAAGLTDEKKLNVLYDQRKAAIEELAGMVAGSVKAKEKQLEIEKLTNDILTTGLKIEKDRASNRLKNAEAEKELARTRKEIEMYLASTDEKRKAKLAEIAELEKTIALNKFRGLDASKEIKRVEELRKDLQELKLDKEKESVRIAELQLKGLANLTDAEKVELELLEGKTTKLRIQAEIQALLAKGVANLTDEEKKRLAALANITVETKKQVDNLATQKKLLEDMTKIAGGAAFNEASDEALAERYRRTKQTVIERQLKLQANPGDFTTRLDTGRLQVELENIQREMEARQRLRRDFAIGGEAAARRNFKGDPLEFDRVFQQLVTDTRDTKQIQAETLTQLREINQRQKSGIAVVNLNSK